MYLSLVAKTVYFLDYQQPTEIDIRTVHKRLFMRFVPSFCDPKTHS
jgi:hypothetical protein